MRYFIFILSLSLFTSVSMNAYSNSKVGVATYNTSRQLNTLSGTIPADPDNLSPGHIWKSYGNTVHPLTCVKGHQSIELLGNTAARVEIAQNLDARSILDLLKGSGALSLKGKVFTLEGEVDIATELASDEYSMSTTIYSHISPKKRVLVPFKTGDSTGTGLVGGYELTPACQQAVDGSTDPQVLYQEIGDGFISAIQYTAYALIDMKITFKSKKDKEEYGGSLKASYKGIKVEGTLEYVEDNVLEDIKIEISGKQVGGNPDELLAILSPTLDGCSLLDFKEEGSCAQTLERAVNYINSVFPNQLTSIDDYYPLVYRTESYTDSGFIGLQMVFRNSAEEATHQSVISEIDFGFMQSKALHERAARVLRFYASQLPSEHISQLETFKFNAQKKGNIYKNIGDHCLKHPSGTSCIDYYQAHIDEATMINLDTSILNVAN